MKRMTLITFLFLLPIIMTVFSTSINALSARALYDGNAVSDSVDILVDHVVQFQEGGLVLVNDSIGLSTKSDQSANPIKDFLIGFPFEQGANLVYINAYETLNPTTSYRVILDAEFGKEGFFGLKIIFPEATDISGGKSFNFTVFSVFADQIKSTSENQFTADFPLIPGLVQNASRCNVKVILPSDADYIDSSFRYRYLRPVLSNTIAPLEEFTYAAGWVTFEMSVRFLLFDAEVHRSIKLGQIGHIFLSDSYSITNKASNSLPRLDIQLVQDAYHVSAKDQLGVDLNIVKSPQQFTPNLINYTVEFKTELAANETQRFTIFYEVPWTAYLKVSGFNEYSLNFTLLEKPNGLVKKLTLTITLPEGAEYVRIEPALAQNALRDVQKDAFDQTLALDLYGATSFQDLQFTFEYTHLIYWTSFRPTLWVGVLVVAVSLVALVWRIPKQSAQTVSIPLEELKNFIDLYKEKTRITLELDSLEERARKGKIPRRRYKTRRTTLEGRLSVAKRDLAVLREKMRSAEPRYVSIMRQMEIAETELEGAETDIRRAKLRYQNGEISALAYRKLLEDSDRRKDRAQTSLDECLLRMKEEIR